MVTSLRSKGPTEQNGVAVGDLVEALDSEPVASIAQASAYMRHDTNAVVQIRLLHNDGTHVVTLRLNGNIVHGA
jgi:C-terminal processing protease CtpA/Prc